MIERIGNVEAIVIGPEAGGPLHRVRCVEAVAGRGLKGDRYYEGRGAFNRPPLDQTVREVTLIAAEALRICEARAGRAFLPEELRRNLVVSGFDLADANLVRFRVGRVLMRRVRTAPPCRYLSRLLGADMMAALKGIGGIRAVIEEGGTICVGEPVVALD